MKVFSLSVIIILCLLFVFVCFVFLSFFKAHISEHLLAKKKSHRCSWKKITTYEWLLWIYQATLRWYLHELIQWRPGPYGQENDVGFFWYVFFMVYLYLLEHLSHDNERKHQEGGKWTSQVCTYFYKENGEFDTKRYSLQQSVEDPHGTTNSEEIQNIGSYRCPISKNGEENLSTYHQFVVIKTTNWYCSIWKDSEKILQQRSKAKDRVEKCKEGQARYTPVKMIVEIEGEGSMRDLIKFICENELKNFV